MNFFEAGSQTPTLVLGRKCFDSDRDTQDERLPLLIVLLQQLDTSIHGLEALPDYELSEIIFATVRVCGFVEPMDALQAIAMVLQALQIRHPDPETVQFWADGRPPS